MRGIFKAIGSLLFISILMAHFLFSFLFLAPVPKLLNLIVPNQLGFLRSSDVPQAVQSFLKDNHVQVSGDYKVDSDFKAQLISKILEIRKKRFMSYPEQLALSMNLLSFGNHVLGMKAASDYYLKKPLSGLSDKEWIMLINLQKIISH